MKTSEVLSMAADKIERDGWLQNKLTDGGRACCVRGGLLVACGYGVPWTTESMNALHDRASDLQTVERLLTNATGTEEGDLPEWNNAPGRTAAEVIAMLRAVAMTERARESRLLPVVSEQVTA